MEIEVKQINKNKFGQYFTPEIVANFMICLANLSPESKILEPSCGEGIFLNLLQQKGYENLTAYEIDQELGKDFSCIKYESFVSANINDKFDLIIGNPPYIRWKNLEEELKAELSYNFLWNKYFNSLCDYLYIFILKSIELLNNNGQLIFICPEYWTNTTHSNSLRNYMMENGYFEEIYHFNETPIFNNVTVSIIIFKFIKNKEKQEKIKVAKFYANKKLTFETLIKLHQQQPLEDAEYIKVSQFKANERWILQSDFSREKLQKLELACQKQNVTSLFSLFEENKKEYYTIGEMCDIGNGLVSGLDKAFQLNGNKLNEYEKNALITVVKAKDLSPYFYQNITKYIFTNEDLTEEDFKKKYPNFFIHFQKYKADLEKRYQYNRTIKYWEWAFLRNYNLFCKPEKRIFVPCKERISNKNNFRFALIDKNIFPTQDVTAIFKKSDTKESIEYILSYLNQPIVFEWLKSNGIIKGNIVEFSEKPISSIPFKKIDWKNNKEVFFHNSITKLTQQFLTNASPKLLNLINQFFNQLFEI